MLSPLLFILVLDCVLRTTTQHARYGKDWAQCDHLEELSFSDVCLVSDTKESMQEKVNRFQEYVLQIGQKINTNNTKRMRLLASDKNHAVMCNDLATREDDKFMN